VDEGQLVGLELRLDLEDSVPEGCLPELALAPLPPVFSQAAGRRVIPIPGLTRPPIRPVIRARVSPSRGVLKRRICALY